MRETIEIVKCDICGMEYDFSRSKMSETVGSLKVRRHGLCKTFEDICGNCSAILLESLFHLERPSKQAEE
jgi:hypothetical protein